jgi:hypothetical protein
VLAGTALAAKTGSVTATVKESGSSATVTITNGSGKPSAGFFINSTDNPKITGVSNKACKLGTSPWSAKGKKHVDYWANCATSVSVAAGKTLMITLTINGKGTIFVWVKNGSAHGTQTKIGQGD